MRIQDVITESKQIDEAPAGVLSQVGRRLGAKALGAIGFKGKAAELTGKADVGAEANKLMTDFRGYLGKTGGNLKQVQGPQLAAFLKSKGYPNMHLKSVQGVMTTKQVDQAILKAAQDAAAADGDPTVGQGAAPAATTAKGPAPAKSGSSSGTGSGSSTTNVNVGTPAAQTAATPGAAPAASAAPAGVPPALLKKITQLSAREKKQLAGML